ncbi:MAG: acyltransferase [Actinobacteria bacterium]|nr:acyltransferase [Actinomycetota bacterium]
MDARDGTRAGRSLPALDGVRGIAILLVFAYHAIAYPGYWFLGGGFLGVDLFFVLSGFLITMLLVREWDRHGGISLPRFYSRRALRLLPALAVLLAGYAVLTTAFDGASTLWVPLALSAGYVSNVAQGWFGYGMPSRIRQLWSLATEEQFYLLWPALLIVVLRFGRGRTRPLVLVAAGLAAASAATCLGMALAGVNYLHLYFAPETTFDELFVGCLFGIWFARGGPHVLERFRRPATFVSCAFIAWAAWSMNTWADPRLYRYVTLLFALACGVVIYSAASAPASPLARGLSAPSLRYFGRISYALYLWHPLVFWALPLAVGGLLGSRMVAMVLAVIVAELSTRFVEQPFLRLKDRPRHRASSRARDAAGAAVA